MKRPRLVNIVLAVSGVLLLAPAAWAVQGGCCLADGTCRDSTRDDDCVEVYGGIKPDPSNTTAPCSAITCPELEGGVCSTNDDCFPGMGLQCLGGICSNQKMAPAASTTGLLLLIAALGIGGGFAATRRRI